MKMLDPEWPITFIKLISCVIFTLYTAGIPALKGQWKKKYLKNNYRFLH